MRKDMKPKAIQKTKPAAGEKNKPVASVKPAKTEIVVAAPAAAAAKRMAKPSPAAPAISTPKIVKTDPKVTKPTPAPLGSVAPVPPAPPAARVVPAPPAARVAPAQPAARVAPAQPAPPVAPVPVAPQVTTITARIDVGLGNALFIRGAGHGLSWEQGQMLECTDSTTWVWSTTQARSLIAFKLLLNDQVWSQGDDLTVEAGKQLEVTPVF